MEGRRIFAIVPAAGQSRRMQGKAKLLLPWGRHTIIESVLEAWTNSEVTHTFVVVRQSQDELARACNAWPVELVAAIDDPQDMKESIQCGLRHIETTFGPISEDRWMVAPADIPSLTPNLINPLIAAAETETGVVAAEYGGRRGHPILFPWALASRVFGLRTNQGINVILEELSHVATVNFPSELRPRDIDTPEDYSQISSQ